MSEAMTAVHNRRYCPSGAWSAAADSIIRISVRITANMITCILTITCILMITCIMKLWRRREWQYHSVKYHDELFRCVAELNI